MMILVTFIEAEPEMGITFRSSTFRVVLSEEEI